MSAVLKHEPPIKLLRTNVQVDGLVRAIEARPELWDANTFRTAEGGYSNPHGKLSDIICRYRDWSEWTGERRAFVDPPFRAVWWEPGEILPVQELVYDLARLMWADEIGAVLITKIPPRTNCEAHRDIGWAAKYFRKFALQLKAHPDQAFCFEDARLVTAPGDLFEFDNSQLHWVENPSAVDRWTLIITLHVPDYTCRNYRWSKP